MLGDKWINRYICVVFVKFYVYGDFLNFWIVVLMFLNFKLSFIVNINFCFELYFYV